MRTVIDENLHPASVEDELVAEAKRNPQAFAGLYDLYSQRVYRYLLSKTSNPQEAEDLTAQTFLAALQALPNYRHRGNFAAWLFSIARNKTVDHFRRRKPQVSLDELPESAVGGIPLQLREKSERVLDLTRLIEQLSEDEQELLRLRYVAEMRFREIAALVGKKESAVKKTIYRLLARLERQLEVDGE